MYVFFRQNLIYGHAAAAAGRQEDRVNSLVTGCAARRTGWTGYMRGGHSSNTMGRSKSEYRTGSAAFHFLKLDEYACGGGRTRTAAADGDNCQQTIGVQGKVKVFRITDNR